jgi:LPS export ABC transporter protein LptC
MSSPTDMAASTDTIAHSAKPGTSARPRLASVVGMLALGGAAALLGTFIWQAGVLAPPAPQDVKSEDTIAKPDQITSSNASIAGRDKNNRPFEINATSGEQDKVIENLVHMQRVTGVFERPNGAKLDVRSDTGQFDRKGNDLQLTGNVVFSEGSRFTARMEKAAINTLDQSLSSQSAVKVDMQGTMIEADSLTVTGEGTRILFKGGVKARFADPKRKTGDVQ